MELTAGYPFWLIKDGLPFQYKKLSSSVDCEVAIIGGGISGALTAFALTHAGIGCVLLDGRTIGLGSTCASTSLLQYELDIPLYQLVKKIGEDKAFQAYRLCGEAIDKLISLMDYVGYKEYERRNSLFFSGHSSERSFMKKELTARKKAGFEVELLSKEEIGKSYGCMADSAILSAQGAVVNAYSLTHALLQHSIGKGLRVFDRSGVTDIQYNNSCFRLTTAEGHRIKANKLVNATGFEVTQFIKKNIVDFYSTYAIASEQMETHTDTWERKAILWNTDDPYLYIRLTSDNRILIGGRDEHFSNKITRELYLEKKSMQLEKDFRKLFAGGSFRREFAWSGTFGKTKDALPYIGGFNGVFYALGFGGNGITFSVLAAEIICDLIQGKNNTGSNLFSFNRK